MRRIEIVRAALSSYELRSINEAAIELRLSPFTLRAWIKEGRLHAVRLGRRLFIAQAEIDRIVRDSGGIGARSAEISTKLTNLRAAAERAVETLGADDDVAIWLRLKIEASKS